MNFIFSSTICNPSQWIELYCIALPSSFVLVTILLGGGGGGGGVRGWGSYHFCFEIKFDLKINDLHDLKTV